MRRILASVVVMMAVGTASAVPVTYDFTGSIIPGFGFGLVLPPELSPANVTGKGISGSVTFDDATPDLSPDDGIVGTYNAILRLSAQVNGLDFVYDAHSPPPHSGASVYVQNYDGPPGPSNLVEFRADGVQPAFLEGLGSGHEQVFLQLAYETFDIDAISSDAIPANLETLPLDLGWSFFIAISDPTRPTASASFVAENAHVTAHREVSVPEPGPLTLLALGLAAVIASRRITRRAARAEEAGRAKAA